MFAEMSVSFPNLYKNNTSYFSYFLLHKKPPVHLVYFSTVLLYFFSHIQLAGYINFGKDLLTFRQKTSVCFPRFPGPILDQLSSYLHNARPGAPIKRRSLLQHSDNFIYNGEDMIAKIHCLIVKYLRYDNFQFV